MAVLESQTMDTGAIAFSLPLMALSALYFPGGNIIVRMLDRQVGMATGAGIRFVRGGSQFGRINKQRNGFAGGVGFEKGLIGMTIEAGAVFDRLGPEPESGQKNKTWNRHPV